LATNLQRSGCPRTSQSAYIALPGGCSQDYMPVEPLRQSIAVLPGRHLEKAPFPVLQFPIAVLPVGLQLPPALVPLWQRPVSPLPVGLHRP